MNDIVIIRAEDVKATHKKHQTYEYTKRELVPFRKDGQCKLSLYEIPPRHSAYPYHYHTQNEEIFYILQGRGLLRTVDGEKEVGAGDFIFFPASSRGAHKLTNISETETLVYLDFDTHNEIDVTFYPDSGKVGIWGKDINQVYRVKDKVDYYDGE
jgi:uncharacterized cupin superfamily protein